MKPILHGPEKLEDQGLGSHQTESGDRAIASLLCDASVSEQVDLVLTYRHGEAGDGSDGHYEAWSRRGRVRFRRWITAEGLSFEVIDILGENPLANQDPHALKSVQEEIEASIQSGFDGRDPSRRFIGPEQQSYPHAYERIAQLFDSPHAPDLVISPKDWTFGYPDLLSGLWARGSGPVAMTTRPGPWILPPQRFGPWDSHSSMAVTGPDARQKKEVHRRTCTSRARMEPCSRTSSLGTGNPPIVSTSSCLTDSIPPSSTNGSMTIRIDSRLCEDSGTGPRS
jgi:hypothetical protein